MGIVAEGVEFVLIGKDGVLHHGVHILFKIALVFFLDSFEEIGVEGGVKVFIDIFEQGDHGLAVGLLVVVLEEFLASGFQPFAQTFDLVAVTDVQRGLDTGALVCEQRQLRAGQQPFVNVLEGLRIFAAGLVGVLQAGQRLAVAGILVVGPFQVVGLNLFFHAHGVQGLQSLVLLKGIFPVVGAGGIFGGVLDADLGVGGHLGLPYVQLDVTDVVAQAVGHIHCLLQSVGGDVAVCGAGESHHHGEVTVLHTLDAYRKEVLGL